MSSATLISLNEHLVRWPRKGFLGRCSLPSRGGWGVLELNGPPIRVCYDHALAGPVKSGFVILSRSGAFTRVVLPRELSAVRAEVGDRC